MLHSQGICRQVQSLMHTSGNTCCAGSRRSERGDPGKKTYGLTQDCSVQDF